MSSQIHIISFEGSIYEINLGTFNGIFGFPPIMDLPNHQLPSEFNLNAFWDELSGSVRYNTSSFKCTHVMNPILE